MKSFRSIFWVLSLIISLGGTPVFAQVQTEESQAAIEHAQSCPKSFAVPTLLQVAQEFCKANQAVCGKPSWGRTRVDFKFDANGNLSEKGNLTGCRAVYKNKGMLVKNTDQQGVSTFKYKASAGKDLDGLPQGHPLLKKIKIRDDQGTNAGLKINCRLKKNRSNPNCVGTLVKDTNLVQYGKGDGNHVTMMYQGAGKKNYDENMKTLAKGSAPIEPPVNSRLDGLVKVETKIDQAEIQQRMDVAAKALAEQKEKEKQLAQETPAKRLLRLWKDPRYAATYQEFKERDTWCSGFKLSDLKNNGAALAQEAGIDMPYAGKYTTACQPLLDNIVNNKCHSNRKGLGGFAYPFVQSWSAAVGKSKTFQVNGKSFNTCSGKSVKNGTPGGCPPPCGPAK